MKTYHRGLGVGFENNEEFKSRLLHNASSGRMLAYFLYIDGTPRCFYIGTLYEDTLHLGFTGYDPGWKKYELGTILLFKIIEDLMSGDKATHGIDFGFGDAFYKRRFANNQWKELELYIFSDSFKARSINILRNVILFFEGLIRYVIAKANIEDNIKNMWRKRLSSK